MPGPSPRPPFDQGLFLTHLNKAKDHHAAKRDAEAERELEEAYLLRPRDQTVLNLLGLVYYRQGKLDKAEEVYRKLVAESGGASPLYHNLGLITLKLGRLDEAEALFIKALELSTANPRISFYLGSIYERQNRFQDAIYRYRQAGANLLVRRVQDKLAAGSTDRTSPALPVRTDDTAEFNAREVHEAFRRHEEEEKHGAVLSPPRPLEPVSPGLLAEGAPGGGPAAVPSGQPASGSGRLLSFPARDTAPPAPLAPAPPAEARRTGREVFHVIERHLMEINLSGRVFIKAGTIYSYGGNLTFWVKDQRRGPHPALVMITGLGRVILTERDRDITFLRVEGEPVYVEPGHLLACEETLTPRFTSVHPGQPAVEFLALEGSGMVALSVASKPLTLEIVPELPVAVPAASIVLWSGRLIARVLENSQLHEVMLPGRSRSPLVRLEGTGRVLVEQHLPG
jgi:tetratricopeptide (TPR) repeat protein/uncharacterized protein (AIM24 family)